MAFNKLMRAFGFRGNDDDMDENNIEYPSALPLRHAASESGMPESGSAACESDEAKNDVAPATEENPDFPLTIFDSLLQVFNDAQPDFIKKCLDMNAQRRYLYDSVDSSFKEYVASLQADIKRKALEEAEISADQMRNEVEQLQERVKSVEKLEADYKQLRMSHDRQKRSFNDRIRDLEDKVSAVEAEKEQYQLEIKSLLNKLKVAAVYEKDAKAYKDDLENLRRQMKDGVSEEVSQLKEMLENANKQITAMNGRNMVSEVENGQLKKDIKTLNSLVSDQKKAIEESGKAVEETKRECDAKMADADAKTSCALEKLADAESRLRAAEQKLKESEALIAELEAKTKEAPQSAPEKVEPISPQPAALSDEAEADKPRRKKRKQSKKVTKISAIDESLDETEWLVATPPAGVVVKPSSIVSDSEFGYQEPPRKQPPVNDAQMSLF